MRRMNLKRLPSFFTFDLPINYKFLYSYFRRTQEEQRCIYASWPTGATRQKLISDYWGNALLHYLLLMPLSTGLVFLFSINYRYSINLYLLALFLIGIFAYLPMYFLIYRPTFNRDFLPNLEAVVAEYEGKERAWLEKCKQDQPTNRTLALFFYAIDKTSNMSYLSATGKCADLLHKTLV